MFGAVMTLFYGLLSGLVILLGGSPAKKQTGGHTAELLSTAGGILAGCCFVLLLFCGYLTTLSL